MLMAKYHGYLLDVKGAFLKGKMKPNEKLYMKVLQWMTHHYPKNTKLLTIYGLKQAAFRFWEYLLEIIAQLGCTRSDADPCLYCKWTEEGLVMCLSWVDDCFITGPKGAALKLKMDMMTNVDCDDGGELKEYVGCKIDQDREARTLKITQPVLLQSFKDELETDGNDYPNTPGIPMKTLQLGNKPAVVAERRTYYRSGVGKLMHLKRWSRPEMINALRDLSRYNGNGSEEHVDAMHRAMRYAIGTPNRGLNLAPTAVWDGNPNFEFTIHGTADASYKPYKDSG
jgi:hypothetical protein